MKIYYIYADAGLERAAGQGAGPLQRAEAGGHQLPGQFPQLRGRGGRHVHGGSAAKARLAARVPPVQPCPLTLWLH